MLYSSLFWQPNWQFASILVKIIPSFFRALPLCSYSVLCPGYSLVRVLYFPSLTGSLTGTKPVCLIGNTGRDRPVVAVFSVCES